MSIRSQLLLLIIVPLICAVAGAGGLIYANRATAVATSGSKQLAPLAAELDDFILFLKQPPPGSGKAAHFHLQAVKNRISSLSIDIKPKLELPGEKKLIDQIKQVPAGLDQKLAKATQGTGILPERGAQLLIQEIREATPLLQQLSLLYQQTEQAAHNKINQLILLLMAVSTAWITLIALFLYRTLAVPVSQIRDGIAALTRGDFSYRLRYQSDKELGRIASGFNKMIEVRQKTEQTAREVEERAKELFENLQAIVVGIDSNGAITQVNSYFLNMTGKRANELLGRNWFDLFLPDQDQAKQQFIQSIIKGEYPTGYCTEITIRRGERRTIAWFSVTTRDTSGTINGLMSIGEDISDRLAGEQKRDKQLQTLQLMIDANQQALVLVDNTGTILTANSSFGRRFNRPPDQLVGTSLFALFDQELARERRTRFEAVVADGQPAVIQDKRAFWSFENHLFPIKDQAGRVTAVSILSIDITDKLRDKTVQAEDQLQLKTANEVLQQKIDSYNDVITKLQDDIARAGADTIAASARTAWITGQLQNGLQQQIGELHKQLILFDGAPDSEHIHQLIDTARNNATELVDLIELSTMQQSELTPVITEFNLHDLLHRLAVLGTIKAAARGIRFKQLPSSDLPRTISGDSNLLEQLLSRLLGYVIRGTSEGTVTATIVPGQQSADSQQTVLIYQLTSDTGYDITASGRDTGFLLCRQLAECLNGELSTITDQKSGSGLRLVVPYSSGAGIQTDDSPLNPSAELLQRYQPLQGLRVTVITGLAATQVLLQEMLNAAGITVATPEPGLALKHLAQADSPADLLLLDDYTSGNNKDLLKEIRRQHTKNSLPIIIMTAQRNMQEQLLAAGADAVLEKPVLAAQLYEQIARCSDRIPESALPGRPEPELPETLPGIDRTKALARTNGNHRLLAQLIRLAA